MKCKHCGALITESPPIKKRWQFRNGKSYGMNHQTGYKIKNGEAVETHKR